jgi:hypothetical protein
VTRATKAGAAYFALVFAAAFCLGAARTLLAAPVLGETGAVLLEAPALLVVIVLAARWAVERFDVPPDALSRLGMGAVALSLQQAGDLAVATGLRGLSAAAYLADFATARGAVYAAMLAVFLATPSFVRRPAGR